MKKNRKKWKEKMIGLFAFFYCLFLTSVPVFATNKITEHFIFKGFIQMIKDATTAIQIVSGVLAALILAYIGITNQNNSNEQEEKQTNQKVKLLLKGLLIALGSSTIINIFLGYVMPNKKIEETAMLLISYMV